MPELRVEVGSSHSKVSSYNIGFVGGKQTRITDVYLKELEHLRSLRGRIEQMARAQLGKAFVDIAVWSEFLELRVKAGTSRNPKTKFKLRNLFGWICLMDIEQKKRKRQRRR